MFKLILRYLYLLLPAFAVLQAAAADNYPKREMRAVWVATAWQIDWPTSAGTSASTVSAQKNEAIATLDLLKASGFNAVYFQVRPMADRLYALNSWTDPKTGTKYTVSEPWGAAVSGSRGTAPSYDPLQFWLDEAHKRGMELHAWVNPYRMNASMSTTEDKAVADWIITYQGSTSKRIFNPALAQSIARIQNVCRVLTGNYDIDGIVFDDYFYPEGMGSDTATDVPDYADYQSYKAAGGTMSMADWRRDNVNRMVSAANSAIKSIKPWVRFGVAPAGAAGNGLKPADGLPPLSQYCRASDWQYASLASDPIAWLRDKSLDYISPQLYWVTTHSTNPFGPMAEWWSIVATKFGRHFIASHSISFLQTANTEANWAEVAKQVSLNRQNTADGNFGSIIYSAASLNGRKASGLCDHLADNCFQYKSTIPAMTWFEAENPGAVRDLTYDGSTLSWTANSTGRYLVYAIPDGTARTDAESADGGLRAEYIVDITYSPALTIPNAQRIGYWYAVAPLDRYGNEWDIATFNEQNDYQPVTDGADYSPKVIGPKKTASLTSLWIRRTSDSMLDLDIELHRDMVARAGDAGQPDVVYIISRAEASSSTKTELIRYDADSGEKMSSLQLTYDADFNPGFYPGNGILLDDANQLVTHTLTLAGGKLSLAVVNPLTGACTTMFSQTSTYRVDHLDVYGNVSDGNTWYVFAASPTAVTRWTMNGQAVVKKEEMSFGTLGNAVRIHAVSADRFWLSGQATHAALYDFGKSTAVATLGGSDLVPSNVQSTAAMQFVHDSESYLLYQYSYPTAPGVMWGLANGTAFDAGIDGASLLWTFPENGGGTATMVSGDFGAPVSVIGTPITESSENDVLKSSTRLYAYSPGNTLVAYRLTHSIETGVENITVDTDDNSGNNTEWYDLRGIRIDHPTAPGLYIKRQGSQSTKVTL